MTAYLIAMAGLGAWLGLASARAARYRREAEHLAARVGRLERENAVYRREAEKCHDEARALREILELRRPRLAAYRGN